MRSLFSIRIQLHRASNTHLWGGEGQELEEMASYSFTAKGRKTKDRRLSKQSHCDECK